MQQPPAFRIQPNDPKYVSDAAGEAEYFDKPRYFGTHLAIALPVESPFQAYTNTRLTGDPRVRWFDTIPSYGDFRHGLFFGVSDPELEAHILEQNPNLHLTFMDISPESLAKRQDVLGARFPGRVATLSADLNFVEFEPETYDLIISFSVLHHLQNIEWIAHQIARALRPGGYFFLNDYVAENRFDFTPQRRAIFEALIARAKKNGDVPQSWTIPWPVQDPWVYSPFEAIRCEDTQDVLAGELDLVTERGVGALTVLLYLVTLGPEDDRRDQIGHHMWRPDPHSLKRKIRARLGRDRLPAMSKQFEQDLFLMDSLCIDSGLLTPLVAFAVYRKRA